MTTAYSVLGIDQPAKIVASTEADRARQERELDERIARAWRQMAIGAHPDKPGNTLAKATRINLAYETIKTAELRAKYDAKLDRIGVAPLASQTSDPGEAIVDIAVASGLLTPRNERQVRDLAGRAVGLLKDAHKMFTGR